ncbi:conserved hypothetical protein [Ricinus communis]|uniref:Uncharacterized protein n=2 Tax=Ricinus communis TaxID=3988 RepID=B9RVF0_RICCO|nr:conserved hypothetical protein [Ricinus communis]
MLASSSNLPRKTLKIKKQNDDKLFSKQLTSQKGMISMAKPKFSIEDYHGGSAVAVPFTWESQPGTPKINHFRENPLPPLTPPPSYFYNSSPKPKPKTRKHSRPNNLFNSIFPKRTASTRKTAFPASPASSSNSSSTSSSSFSSRIASTSYSVPSSPVTVSRGRIRCGISSPRKSFESSRMVQQQDEDHEHECESPVSTLCFGNGGRGASARSRGFYASMIKVLLRDV